MVKKKDTEMKLNFNGMMYLQGTYHQLLATSRQSMR